MAKKINSLQIKVLHMLLNSTQLMPHKKDLVASFTAGRSESSKDLYEPEADQFITYLKSLDRKSAGAEKMRRKIIHLAREMGWETWEGSMKKADMNRINGWCITYGFGKKELNKYSPEELPKLVGQMEMAYEHYLSNI